MALQEMKEKNDKITITGKCVLIEQEGGYAAPIIQIGEVFLDNIFNDLVIERMDETNFGEKGCGNLKITIERIK